MRDATQRTFNATQHNGHIVERFTTPLAVNQSRTVGAFAAFIARGVSVVTANFAISRVTVDHRVHVARCHAEKQIGFAQHFERVSAVPLRLRDDAHPKALRFEHATNHRHAKAGVIDIRVASDDDDVAAVPAELRHFFAAHRQKRSRAKTSRPELAVTGQRLGIARKKRNIGVGTHGRAQV